MEMSRLQAQVNTFQPIKQRKGKQVVRVQYCREQEWVAIMQVSDFSLPIVTWEIINH
jgi:hypothetical protein